MNENFEGNGNTGDRLFEHGQRKSYEQIRREAKEHLIKQGESEREAEQRISVSLDKVQNSDEQLSRVLANIYHVSPAATPEVKPKKKEREPVTNREAEEREDQDRIGEAISHEPEVIHREEKRIEAERAERRAAKAEEKAQKRAEKREANQEAASAETEASAESAASPEADEHITIDTDVFPRTFEEFSEYLMPGATVEGEPAPHIIVDLISKRLKAFETPLDIAGMRTKKAREEKLAELGLASRHQSLQNEAKRLNAFLKDSVKMKGVDPLTYRSRFVHLQQFVQSSEALYNELETKLGLAHSPLDAATERVSQTEHEAHANDVKESLDEVITKLNGDAQNGSPKSAQQGESDKGEQPKWSSATDEPKAEKETGAADTQGSASRASTESTQAAPEEAPKDSTNEAPKPETEEPREAKEQTVDSRAAFLDSVKDDIAKAIPNAFAITTPIEYLKIHELVKEGKRLLASVGDEDDVWYGMYGHLNDREEVLKKVDAIIDEIKEYKSELLAEYGGVSPAKEAAPKESPVEPNVEPSNYELARTEWANARKEWLNIKNEYDTAIAAHYRSLAERNLFSRIWNRNGTKSPELLSLQEKYLESRKQYVGAIRNALGERANEYAGKSEIKRTFENKGIKHSLAERLIVNPVRSELDLKKEIAEKSRPEIVQKVQKWFEDPKLRSRLKATAFVVGVVSTFGLSFALRTVREAATAYGGTVGTAVGKSPLTTAFSGAALGAIAGGFLGNRGVEYFSTRNRREDVTHSKQQAYDRINTDSLAGLEAAYLRSEVALQKSEALKRRATVAGAVVGGAAGAYLGGMDGSEFGDTTPPVPEEVPEVPEATEAPEAPSADETPTVRNVGPDNMPPEDAPEPVTPAPTPTVPPAETLPPQSEAPVAPVEPPPTPESPEPVLDPEPPAPEAAAEETPASVESYTVKAGDNVWNIMKERYADHLGSLPNEAAREVFLDSLKDRLSDDAALRDMVGLGDNIDLIQPGDTLNVAPLDTLAEELIQEGTLVTETDVAQEAAATEVSPDASIYTAVKGDNVWNILEGKGSDANPQGGLSEVVKDMTRAERNRALDTLMDYLEENPEFTKAAGIESGDPDRLAIGDRVNVGMLDAKLRELLGMPELPATMEAPPMRPEVEIPTDIDHAEAETPAVETAPATQAVESNTPSIESGARTMGEMRINELVALYEDLQHDDPTAIETLNRLDMDRDMLEDLLMRMYANGPAGVNESLTANEWLNSIADERLDEEMDASTPVPEVANESVREASLQGEAAPVAVLDVARNSLVAGVEGSRGFLNDLFGSSTAGTFAKLEDVPMSEIGSLLTEGREQDLVDWLSARGISEAGFEKWINWISDEGEQVLAVDPNLTFGEYVSGVAEAQSTTVAA